MKNPVPICFVDLGQGSGVFENEHRSISVGLESRHARQFGAPTFHLDSLDDVLKGSGPRPQFERPGVARSPKVEDVASAESPEIYTTQGISVTHAHGDKKN